MKPAREQPQFEVNSIIEQKPFENPAVQSFFTKWCEINDSIEPQVVSRQYWEQKYEKSILEKRSDGKQNLYIPEDLQLWEIVWVMEVVDRDTFSAKPERQDEAKKKLLELGETFQNAGIYIAQRLNSIERGYEIARALAEEFYNYGQSLMLGEKLKEPQSIENIASLSLSEQETQAVDRFLAGENLYESRQARVENKAIENPDKKNELYEIERQKTLAQFFRASAKAFELKTKSERWELQENNNHLKPWQNDTPFHNAFITKIEKAVRQQVETPKRGLEGSIFRRGMELLLKNMPFDKLPDNIKNSILHWQDGETTLREALQINNLKSELENIRQTGNLVNISNKEREITDKIQMAVKNFEYETFSNNPSEMITRQIINCVGASTLGGALMREVGLKYLLGSVPEHSILFLITSDGHVVWRDMLSTFYNEDLTNEMIRGDKEDGTPLTTTDIIKFSQKPKPQGLMFDLTVDKMNWVKDDKKQWITLFEPEYGQQIQILNNTGGALYKLNLYNQAIIAFQEAIDLEPKFSYPHQGLASTFYALGRYEEALGAYRQAISINPDEVLYYYGIGNTLFQLGRTEEAMDAYQKFIDLSHGQGNDDYIKAVRDRIAKFKQEKHETP